MPVVFNKSCTLFQDARRNLFRNKFRETRLASLCYIGSLEVFVLSVIGLFGTRIEGEGQQKVMQYM
jgi:hypothetical protein